MLRRAAAAVPDFGGVFAGAAGVAMADGVIRVMVSRHSAFYSPLISTVAGDELSKLGFETSYDV